MSNPKENPYGDFPELVMQFADKLFRRHNHIKLYQEVKEDMVENQAFVIRGTCQHSDVTWNSSAAFKLRPDQIIYFKFDIEGKLIEYTDSEADISFDKSTNEWVIVLDNLPFILACKHIKLLDICFDENRIDDVRKFKFTINSFESTSKTAILTVELEEGHSDMVVMGGKDAVDEKPMQHIKFLYHSDYCPEVIEKALNTIHLTDKSTDTKYNFNVSETSTSVDDRNILVIDAKGIMYDLDNAIHVSADCILDDDSDFVFTGIELDGSFDGEPGGFIDMVECEYNGVRIPWHTAPAPGFRLIKGDEQHCRLELIYYSTDVNAVINNIDWVEISLPDNVDIRVMIDHTKPVTTSPGHNYSNTSQYYISGVGGSEFYSGDDDLTKIDWDGAVISCIKWHDTRPTVLFESASMIVSGKHYGIVPLTSVSDDTTINEIKRQKMAIQLKNSSIPVQDPVFVVRAEVRCRDLEKDLQTLKSMQINLDGVYHNINKLEISDIKYLGKASSTDPYVNIVTFHIKPLEMGSYGSDVPVKTLHFGNIVVRDFEFSNEWEVGFRVELKEILFNGSTVKIALDYIHNVCVDYTEPVIIQDKSETKTKKESRNYPVIQVVTFIRGDVETHVNNISSLLVEINGTKYQIDDMKSIIRSKFLESDGRYRVMIDFVPLHLISKEGELDVHYLHAYDDIKFAGFATEYIVAGEIDLIKVYISGKEIPIAPSVEQLVYVDVAKEQVQLPKNATLAVSIIEDREHVDFYQVRGFKIEEIKDPGAFKVKRTEIHINGFYDDQLDSNMDSTNVCSELIIKNGCMIDTVSVLDGGYVTIEEGGHVGKLIVHLGGIAELCEGAIVDTALEYGGSVYGDTPNVYFITNTLRFGVIGADQYATIHDGTFLYNSVVCGKLDVHDNSHTIGCTIKDEMHIHGGIHEFITVKEGGKLFLEGGSVSRLTAEPGSRVVIFHGAHINMGELYGEVEYEGDDFESAPGIIDCQSKQKVKLFHIDDKLSVDDMFDELDKE